jgi:hypothetical protein
VRLFKPKYYFTLTKYPATKMQVVQTLYVKNGLFNADNNVYSQYLLTYPKAKWYQLLFWWHHMRGTMHKMFPYKGSVNGYIKLEKIKK